MKLAISNIAWDSLSDDYILSELQKRGVKFLEIAPTRIIPEVPYEKLYMAGQISEYILHQYGMRICSMQSIWFGRTERLFHSEEERAILKEYTQKAILFAETIGCKNLVFGCPKNRNFVNDEEKRNIGKVYDFLRDIGEFAEKHHTCIAVEPNPVLYNTNFINTTLEAIEVVKRLEISGLKVNLDIGTIIENKEQVNDLDFSYINHIHISEPGLVPIQKRELHKVIFDQAVKNHYSNCISIEMGKTEAETIFDTVEYVKTLNKIYDKG